MVKIKNIYLLSLLIFSAYSKVNNKGILILEKQNKTKGLILKCKINSQKEYNLSNAWECYHQTVFDFPKVFELANKKKLPILLLVPENYSNISPVDSEAPWIESARVALTYASVFYRFKNLNVKVLLIPNDQINNFFNKDLFVKLLLKKRKDLLPNPISKIIFNLKNLNILNSKNNLKKYSFSTYSSKFIDKKIEIVNHYLPIDKAKRILVSGAAGFIGSHYVKYLLKKGHQVIALDSLYCGNMKNLSDIKNDNNFYFKQFDISKKFDIPGQIDYIVHLASVPSPEFYYKAPFKTLDSGLAGIKNMLDLAVRKKSKFIFTSTSEVYGDPHISCQHEKYAGNVNPMGMRCQYDESKRGAETLAKLYFDKFGLDIRIARVFNTFGPNMSLSDGRVVTNFCKAILENQPMKIYGDGLQTRSFAFISDTLDGLIKLTFSNKVNNLKTIQKRIFNIGNNKEITIKDLAQIFNSISKDTLDKTVDIEFIPNIDQTDPKQRKPNLKRAYKYLNYKPKINIELGLKETLLYFLNNKK